MGRSRPHSRGVSGTLDDVQFSTIPSLVPNTTVLRGKPGSRLAGALVLGTLGAGALIMGTRGAAPDLPAITPGFGMAFLSAAALLLTSRRAALRLVFDDDRGTLWVHEGDGGKAGQLSYAAIAGFAIREFSARNRTFYVVLMAKRDGGFWQLGTFDRQADAEALRDALRQGVDTTRRPSAEVDAVNLPEGMVEMHAGAVATLRWPRRVKPLFVASFLGVLIGLGMVAYGARHAMPSAASWALMGFFALLTLAVVVSTALGVGKQCEVCVDGDRLRVREPGGARRFELPLAEIRGVTFTLTPDDDSPLLLLDERSERALRSMVQAPDDAGVFSSALELMRTKRIQAADLDITSKLALERWLEREIRKRDREVK